MEPALRGRPIPASGRRQITNTRFERPTVLHVGAELTGQGNGDVRSFQAGAVLEVAFVKWRGSLQFRGGESWLKYRDGSRQSKAYAGIGFYRAF